jgi:uncharacterized membrane protein YeaQ/YmgE (transglycosylase-associated protein family)
VAAGRVAGDLGPAHDGDALMGFLLAIVFSGLIVGALGRLLVPGRQEMGCLATVAAGVSGSIIGGLVGRVLFGPNYAPGLIMSTLAAAALIYLFTRSRQSSYR